MDDTRKIERNNVELSSQSTLCDVTKVTDGHMEARSEHYTNKCRKQEKSTFYLPFVMSHRVVLPLLG